MLLLHFCKASRKSKLLKGHKYMTGITIYNVQMAVLQKACNSELWFLCSAHHIMVIYICIMFQGNISNSFQVTEITIFLCSKGHNCKNS